MAFAKKIIDISLLLVYSTVAIATLFLYYTLIDTGTHNGSLSWVSVSQPRVRGLIFESAELTGAVSHIVKKRI